LFRWCGLIANSAFHSKFNECPFLLACFIPVTLSFACASHAISFGIPKERKALGFYESYQPHHDCQPSTSLTTHKTPAQKAPFFFFVPHSICAISLAHSDLFLWFF